MGLRWVQVRDPAGPPAGPAANLPPPIATPLLSVLSALVSHTPLECVECSGFAAAGLVGRPYGGAAAQSGATGGNPSFEYGPRLVCVSEVHATEAIQALNS